MDRLQRHRTRRLAPAWVAAAILLASPAAAEAADVALLHLVEPDVGSLVAEGIERRIVSGLSGPSDPRLLDRSAVAERLLSGGRADALVSDATTRLGQVRERLADRRPEPELVDTADEARDLLLRALTSRPQLDLIREAWALRGLASEQLGEAEAARRDFARVLESDPSFRPDPRLFPPEARELMGRALMARTDATWRVVAAADAASLGRRLGVPYVVLAHLYDTGLAELAYRVDVFDVAAGRFVGETEVHFPDASAERERVASEIAALVRETVPRGTTVARVPVAPDPPARDPVVAPEPVAPTPERPREPVAVAPGPFDPPVDPPETRSAPSRRGWWVAGAVVAAAAGGAAVWIGLNADAGQADLVVRAHGRDPN